MCLWSGYEERFLTAGQVLYSPECFIILIPGRHHLHQASELGLQLPLEAGDVPLLELGEVTLQHWLDCLQVEEKQEGENLASIARR